MLIRSTKRKKHGSFPYFSVLLGATLSLFVFGYLCSLSLSYYRLQDALRNNLKLSVYLDSGLSETQIKASIDKLKKKNFVSSSEEIVLTTADEFAQEFVTTTGENFTEVLDGLEFPFKDVLSIAIKSSFSKADYLPRIKREIEAVEGVYEADLPKHFKTSVRSLNKTFNLLNVVILSVALLSLAIVFVIIRSSIKLSMFSQRFLIWSMQLVGAKKWIIVRPFVLRAFVNGLLSGVLASGLVYGLYQYGNRIVLSAIDVRVPEEIFNFDDLKIILAALPLLASVLMTVFTGRVVSKYLKYSLDDLY